jgi:hypothetical protein
MTVRVRLKLKSRISGEVVETVALVNTGFETESPQLLIPLGIVVVVAGSGKWRFIDDPVDKVRVTGKPQYWS